MLFILKYVNKLNTSFDRTTSRSSADADVRFRSQRRLMCKNRQIKTSFLKRIQPRRKCDMFAYQTKDLDRHGEEFLKKTWNKFRITNHIPLGVDRLHCSQLTCKNKCYYSTWSTWLYYGNVLSRLLCDTCQAARNWVYYNMN